MVAAQDVFQKVANTEKPSQKRLRKVLGGFGQPVQSLLSAGASVGGYFLTPSRRPLVRVVGGILLSGLWDRTSKRLDNVRQGSASAAVVELLAEAESLKAVDAQVFDALREKYGVPEEEFRQILAEMYLTFLIEALESSVVETTELSELLSLQDLFMLSATQVGKAFYEAAQLLRNRYYAWWEDEEANEYQGFRDKLIFLADRVLSQDESPEGYQYEILRLQKRIGVSGDMWQDTATKVAAPFYAKALRSVLEGKPATSAQLAKIQESLGVSEEVVTKLHATTLEEAVEQFGPGSPRVAEIADIFGCTDSQVRSTLLVHSVPKYMETLEALMDRVGEPGLREELDARCAELQLNAADAANVEVRALEAHCDRILADALTVLRTGSTEQALSKAQELVAFRSAARTLTADEADLDKPTGAKKSDVVLLFRAQLVAYLADGRVDASEQEALQDLRAALGLSVEDAAQVYEIAAGPLARAAMDKAVQGETSEVSRTLKDLGLPPALQTKLAVEVYTEHLVSVGGVQTEEQKAEFARLREVLGLALSNPAVQSVHDEVCAPEYENAVRDGLQKGRASGGEFFDDLKALRARLGLSDAMAEQIYAQEVTEGLRILTVKLGKVLQEQKEAHEKGKLDSGASAVLMGAQQLLDFADGACLFGEGPDGREVAGTNLREVLETDALREVYRQSVIAGFSSTGTDLLINARRLWLLLGLEDSEAAGINDDVGSGIIQKYLHKQLASGPVGPREQEFIQAVQDTLHMSPEKVEQAVKTMQCRMVMKVFDNMKDASDSVTTADDVRLLLDEAERHQVDFVNDLDIHPTQLERLFRHELEDFVNAGGTEGSDLEEAATQFHLSEARVQELLQDVVQKRVSAGLIQAFASNAQGKLMEANEELDLMVKAAALSEAVPKAESLPKNVRSDLHALYQSGGAGPDRSALLAEMLGVA